MNDDKCTHLTLSVRVPIGTGLSGKDRHSNGTPFRVLASEESELRAKNSFC